MNNIFVISGPSGSGKSTLLKKLLSTFRDLHFAVSHTTRKKRPGERNSREYYFVDHKTFMEMVRKGEFAEWARVHDELYGTSLREIRKKSAGKKMVALDIDVQGARIIRDMFPGSIHVFIMPPDMATLRERLAGREKRLNEDFEKRIKTAAVEIGESVLYDHIVVNDDLEKASKQLENIFLKFSEKIAAEKRKGEDK